MAAEIYQGTNAQAILTSRLQPVPYIILTTKNDVDGSPNDCAASSPTAFANSPPATTWTRQPLYMYRYTAECQFAVDLAAAPGGNGYRGAIPPWITWIMYDNELCTLPGTPLTEQLNPPAFYTAAATLAHRNGLSFYATAGLHAAQSPAQGQCGPENPSYDPAALWATAGPPGSISAWDGVDFQTQTGISNPQKMLNNSLNQLAAVRANNASLTNVASGIGDLGCYPLNGGTVCGPIDKGTQEEAIQLHVDAGISSFWGNYGPHPTPAPGNEGEGACTAPTGCPMPAQYNQFADIIIDVYFGTYAQPGGPYAQSRARVPNHGPAPGGAGKHAGSGIYLR